MHVGQASILNELIALWHIGLEYPNVKDEASVAAGFCYSTYSIRYESRNIALPFGCKDIRGGRVNVKLTQDRERESVVDVYRTK